MLPRTELTPWLSACPVLLLCGLNCLCSLPYGVWEGYGIRFCRFLVIAFSSTLR